VTNQALPPEQPYRRPWWLIVNKSTRLVTHIQQETRPGERSFIIRGEPLVQGLGWLTWGPAGALVMILVLVGLAVALGINEQSWGAKFLFIAAFLVLPSLVWGAIALALTRLSQKYVQAERQAEAQTGLIRLNQHQGELFYQTSAQPRGETLAYRHIRQVKVAHAIGGHDHKALLLTLETEQGPVILLNEALGTPNQKMDLAHEIQQALKDYSDRE
jgi:phosphate/sulfate permease